ncbi:cyclic nucleotide-binding domain-containing protein [Spirulina major]|uniref:cyclic nucleotide-binding domain-containing protein n=1 Tax=Spirulina major TaxID=270636 RepID=UPI000932252C|nr:cyclic nucleotide-binding domain-containing protein [Spirulina major]
MFAQIQRTIIQTLQNPLLQIGDTEVTLLWILQIIFAFLIVFLVSRTLKTFIKYKLLARLNIDLSSREAISSFGSYIIGFLGLILVLQGTGFDFSSLIIIAGGLGVGIGFGLQNVTNDIISGITLLLDQKVKVGDFVEFEKVTGTITGIFIRTTIIETLDEKQLIIPNSHLTTTKITNWTSRKNGGWISIEIDVDKHSDPLVVTEILLDCASLERDIATQPTPEVALCKVSGTGYTFVLWAWTPEVAQYYSIQSSLYYSVEYFLRQANINLAKQRIQLERIEPFHLRIDRPLRNTIDATTFPPPEEPKSTHYLHHYLYQVPYFEHFNDLEMRQLIEQGYRQRLKADEILFQEGDKGDSFYIILSGSVDVFAKNLDRSLQTLKRGQFFGELALMLGIPRTASVRALEETLVFAINQHGFQNLLQQHPQLGKQIIQEFQNHQAELEDRQHYLRELGLISPDENASIMTLVRKRLQQLFNIS